MDALLRHAQALYKDRQRIALAAVIICFSAAFYVFYGPPIQYALGEDPVWTIISSGWSQGTVVVFGYSTVGFLLALSVVVFIYAFWSWAFLPSPATLYTMAVLRGIYGSKTQITQRIGKRFRVHLERDAYVDFECRIRGRGSEDWFIYRVTTSAITAPNLEAIALRHGFSVSDGRLITWMSNDELHSRTLLLAKALILAGT
jgi:hypothetical protein